MEKNYSLQNQNGHSDVESSYSYTNQNGRCSHETVYGVTNMNGVSHDPSVGFSLQHQNGEI